MKAHNLTKKFNWRRTTSTLKNNCHQKYLGIHLDRRLTWSYLIDAKVVQIKLKCNRLNWFIGPRSTLDLKCKVIVYKTVIKPIWTYGIQLWGTESASNVSKFQIRLSNILRLISGPPCYSRNSNIYKELEVTMVEDEIIKLCRSYANRMFTYPNTFDRQLLNFEGHIRLKRRDWCKWLQMLNSYFGKTFLKSKIKLRFGLLIVIFIDI